MGALAILIRIDMMNIKFLLLALVFLTLPVNAVANESGAPTGFTTDYEVRQGDFNGDGLIDLYIRQKLQIVILRGDIATPIVIPAPVDEFILQRVPGGQFTLIRALTRA